MRSKILNWFFVVLWCSAIYILSDIPHLKTDLGIFDLIFRKIAHMAEYAMLCFLWLRAFTRSFNQPKGITIAVSVLVCLLYAASDEFHQSFVPGRKGSVIDLLLFDGAGIGFAALIFSKWRVK